MQINNETTIADLKEIHQKHKRRFKFVTVDDGRHKRKYSIDDLEFFQGVEATLTFTKE